MQKKRWRERNYSQRELPVQKLRDANSSNCIKNHKEAQGLEIDELGETREEATIIWPWGYFERLWLFSE